ncbi:WASH complex subunit 2-like isoform X1 [Homarus americanus]|uniref:WASH complex subunit 2-like isoform X1 n=1 Tax=Homarus americanus TaxID=6706 RepID=UPI001C49633E|nr:WASH complex subunit 2-like isoform X1 [Homarus americanus]
MGSTEEDGRSGERWWESTKLSPSDLRQRSESWSLAADAATATLLQSISQRLVSRTHEVEGALEKVLEETDRVMTVISNTNNAFHMLANTQFIENRTYQDDADVVREKTQPKEKPAAGEEDVLTRCKNAIIDGLSLVSRSYERHEMQDSDSEDEDSPGSPVPVYALIDPYEGKPLPLIIGSGGFMADDKVGLQETSSSEDNSKMTLSPAETDTEDELDVDDLTGRRLQKDQPIPASSSKAVDDDSDSDWSDEDFPHPVNNVTGVDKPKSPQSTNDEGEDEDDADFFGPSKTTQSITKNGPNVSSQISKKLNINAATAHISSRGRGLDSDSDDDGDLFGTRRESSIPSAGLFGNTQPPSASRGGNSNDLFGEQNTHTPSEPSVGVENVRAMPNPTRAGPHAVSRPQKSGSNLFASDTDDDEGDLFSSKTSSTTKTRSQSGKAKNQPDQPSTPSTNLFSSDEDGGLFSPATPHTQGTSNNKEDYEQKDEPPPIPSGRKVPVGGINIFGSAVTSAIRRQQSDSEPSDDERSIRGGSRSSSASLTKPEPQPSQGPSLKAANSGKNLDGGGLFDEDDEDLFGSISKKPEATSFKTVSDQTKPLSSTSVDKMKDPDERKNLFKNITSGNSQGQQTAINSSGGLFSDDDDDLFGAPFKAEKKYSTLPTTPAVKSSSSTENAAESGVISSGPAKKPNPSQDVQKTSPPVKVHEVPKVPSTSLFSSPSDDDEDLFFPSSSSMTVKSSAFVTEPPPLPPAGTVSSISENSESSMNHDDHHSSTTSMPQVIKTQESPKTISISSNDKSINMAANQREQGPLSNSLFSSSDDDDLFSSVLKTTHEDATLTQKHKDRTESFKTKEDPPIRSESIISNTTDNTSSQKSKPNLDIFGSPDDIFVPKSKLKDNLPTEGTKPSQSFKTQTRAEKSDLFAAIDSEDDIFSSVSNSSSSGKPAPKSDKDGSSLFGSFDDDIFADAQKGSKSGDASEPKPHVNMKGKKDIFDSSAQPQHQKESPSLTVVTAAGQTDTVITSSVSDRDNPPTLPAETEGSTTPLASERESFPSENLTKVVHKPPVGGVALFGGDELSARINKQKSLLGEREVKDEKVKEEGSKPVSEKTVVKEEKGDRFNKIGSIFDGEVDDSDLFGVTQVKPEKNLFSGLGRESPPPLPTTTVEPSPHSNEKLESSLPPLKEPQLENVKLSEGESIINANDKNRDVDEPGKGGTEVKSEKTEQIVAVEKEILEIKPKKKPPRGGVSMFGGGGIGGKELLAKVQQRKSILEPDSESESDDDDGPVTISPGTSPHKEEITTVSSVKLLTPISPISPMSPLSPVFASEVVWPKSGGQESSVSFDEPAPSTTLQSLNKSRNRGSLKRRPPSRSHRRSRLEENSPGAPNISTSKEYTAPADTVTSSVPEYTSQDRQRTCQEKELSVNDSSVSPDKQRQLDSIFCDDSTQSDIISNYVNTEVKNTVENKEQSTDIVSKKEKRNTALKKKQKDESNDDDLFGRSKSALNEAKVKSISKGTNNSLFGVSDSDDEDLFGEAKLRTSSVKASESSSKHNSSTKTLVKSHPAQSLFGNDDDDIFGSSSKAEKVSASVPRKGSTSKPKSNLKPSSEPFEDPLLSNLK